MLDAFIHILTHLRTDRKSHLGEAPHKPILLLAVFDLVEQGRIRSPWIYLEPELVLAFRENWNRYVITGHTPNFALPFFHLRSEGKPTKFWKLVFKPGMEIPLTSSHSIKSLKSLQEALDHVELDPVLFQLIQDPVGREALRQAMLDRYFPDTKHAKAGYSVFETIQQEMVAEDKAAYQQRIDELERTLPREQFQEEVFVRSAVFKREIPRIYQHTCAVTGFSVSSNTGAQMVDACHIVPFAVSKDDTLKNGICLAPTLHRAFDRGLFFIDDEFRVRLVSGFTEKDSPHAIRPFEGKPIHLPQEKQHWPSPNNLRRHRLRQY